MDNELYVGGHASIVNGYEASLKSIYDISGNAVQIFLKNPRGKTGKPLNEAEALKAKKYLENNKMFLVGHCSYLLNFAKSPVEFPWIVDSLTDDLIRISKLGGVGVVLHVAKYLDMDKDIAFENIRKSVLLVIEKMPNDVKILFENTAGQGTEVGFQFEELAKIYNLFNNEQKDRIGFCIDTCHSHAAGYDLSTKQGVQNWIDEFEKNIGWKKVSCIHLNDSLNDAGSRVDRHADLGFGSIGETGLKEIVRFAKNRSIPLILETPGKENSYEEQIKLVKSWI